jgi:hypothetical protein
MPRIILDDFCNESVFSYFVPAIAYTEQKYQINPQLCGWTTGVLSIDIFNLQPGAASARLETIVSAHSAIIEQHICIQAGNGFHINVCQLGA